MFRKSLSPLVALSLIASIALPCFSQDQHPKPLVIDQTVVVDPGKYISYGFGLDERNLKITGEFRAQGGQKNDIEAYIFDETGYENWINGNQANCYYNSGRVTVAKLNLSLPPGKYFLVFSNTFSVFSNKAVKINVTIE